MSSIQPSSSFWMSELLSSPFSVPSAFLRFTGRNSQAMPENPKGEVSWWKKHHEIMSSVAVILGCYFFLKGHSRVSLTIRKNDSPLNSSISVETKKRETFFTMSPNDVYRGFYWLNVRERFVTHQGWWESESVWGSRAPSLPRYRHKLGRTHWTAAPTGWGTARCPTRYPRRAVHSKKPQWSGRNDRSLWFGISRVPDSPAVQLGFGTPPCSPAVPHWAFLVVPPRSLTLQSHLAPQTHSQVGFLALKHTMRQMKAVLFAVWPCGSCKAAVRSIVIWDKWQI